MTGRPCRLCSHGYAHLGACPADPMLWWVVPPGVPGGLHGGPHVLHRLERAFERPEGAIGEGSWTADGGGQAAMEADIAALATTDDLAWAQRVAALAPHLSCGRTLAESLRAAALDAEQELVLALVALVHVEHLV